MKRLAIVIMLLLILFSRTHGIEKRQIREISETPPEYGKTDPITEGSDHPYSFDPFSWDILGEDLIEMFLHYRGVSVPCIVKWESFPVHDQDFEAMAEKVHIQFNSNE